MEETKNKFTWVQTHKDIVKYLSDKENKQKELLDLLKSVGISAAFKDKDSSGNEIELEEVDPFSFFCFIYKYGPDKRLKFLQEVAKRIGAVTPSDESGIPSANPQSVWLFPYKETRVNNEIKRLWGLFKSAVEDTITDQQFDDVLKIYGTGKAKLTEALFNVNPEKYLPINGPTKPYLKEVLGIDPRFSTYAEYLELLNKVKGEDSKPFYQISYEAWKWNSQREKVNFWIFQGNPDNFDFKTAFDEDHIDTWTVSSHKNEIKTGDKLIIWITGKGAGCYALGEVTKDPHEPDSSSDDHLWIKEDKNKLKAGIKIIHNFSKDPILQAQVRDIDSLGISR